MDITKLEAEQSLADVDRITGRTRKAIAGSGVAIILMIWGGIWIVGYGGSHFFPTQSGMIWAPLCLLGGAASWLLGARSRPVKSPAAARIALFWLALFAYAALWLVLLAPFNPGRMGAFMGTVPMFGYIVGGIWVSRFFVWLGLSVTGLIVLGVFAWPQWSDLWTGLAGGSALVLAGCYIRKNWQ